MKIKGYVKDCVIGGMGGALCALLLMLFMVTNEALNRKEENAQLTLLLEEQEKQTEAWMDESYRLNGEIDRLTEEKAGLEEELVTYQIEVLDLKTQLEALQAQVDDLSTQLVKAQERKQHEYSGITLTEEEWDLCPRILVLEAGNQDDDGQRAVVEVMFNRKKKGTWGGDTIKDVLLAKGQFETVKWLDKPYNIPTHREYNNIMYVLEHGLTVLPSEDYVYFASYSGANGYDEIKLGDHYFAKG